MELKLGIWALFLTMSQAFNRTRMELKLRRVGGVCVYPEDF